jgi:hypothetical protein
MARNISLVISQGKVKRRLTVSVVSSSVNMLLSILSHDSRAFGSWKFPTTRSAFFYVSKCMRARRTFGKVGNKTMCCLINQITLSCNTDGRQNIVSGAHNLSDPSLRELVQDTSCARLQLVFKYYESNKFKIKFRFFTLHLLDLKPIKFWYVFCGTCNNTITSMCIICQEFFIIAGNWGDKLGTTHYGVYSQLSALQISFMHSGAPLT